MIERSSYKCDLCGSSKILQVHHRDLNPANYTNLGNLDNFRVLCSECHTLMHKLHDHDELIMDELVIEQLRLSFLVMPTRYNTLLRHLKGV